MKQLHGSDDHQVGLSGKVAVSVSINNQHKVDVFASRAHGFSGLITSLLTAAADLGREVSLVKAMIEKAQVIGSFFRERGLLSWANVSAKVKGQYTRGRGNVGSVLSRANVEAAGKRGRGLHSSVYILLNGLYPMMGRLFRLRAGVDVVLDAVAELQALYRGIVMSSQIGVINQALADCRRGREFKGVIEATLGVSGLATWGRGLKGVVPTLTSQLGTLTRGRWFRNAIVITASSVQASWYADRTMRAVLGQVSSIAGDIGRGRPVLSLAEAVSRVDTKMPVSRRMYSNVLAAIEATGTLDFYYTLKAQLIGDARLRSTLAGLMSSDKLIAGVATTDARALGVFFRCRAMTAESSVTAQTSSWLGRERGIKVNVGAASQLTGVSRVSYSLTAQIHESSVIDNQLTAGRKLVAYLDTVSTATATNYINRYLRSIVANRSQTGGTILSGIDFVGQVVNTSQVAGVNFRGRSWNPVIHIMSEAIAQCWADKPLKATVGGVVTQTAVPTVERGLTSVVPCVQSFGDRRMALTRGLVSAVPCHVDADSFFRMDKKLAVAVGAESIGSGNFIRGKVLAAGSAAYAAAMMNMSIFSFTPSNINGLYGWWHADSIGLNDGDVVSTWSDSSGNNRNFSKVAASWPKYVLNAINDHNAIQTAAGVFATNTMISTWGIPFDCDIFMVVKIPAVAATSGTIPFMSGYWNSNLNNEWSIGLDLSLGRLYYSHDGSTRYLDGPYSSSNGNFVAMELARRSSLPFLTSLCENGGSLYSITNDQMSSGDRVILAAPMYYSSVEAVIAEIVVYNRRLEDAERAQVYDYLRYKYLLW